MILSSLPDSRALLRLADRARERIREDFGRKAIGAVVAIVLEALLLLALLTLGQMRQPHKDVPVVVTLDAREYTETPHQPAPKPPTESARASPKLTRPARAQPAPEVAPLTPTQPPAAIIPVSPQQMRSFDISNLPKRPATPVGPAIGPAFTPAFGDSKQVGNAPNGQPMYAASWYREPTDQEMRGYLSTAQPGWGLITCKTVADYRVEDCVGLDEYPEGSQIIRAALAAAWQFRVRPPRVGGVSQVGDWVRIRIDYELKPAERYGDTTNR